jgi:hypothetical protein
MMRVHLVPGERKKKLIPSFFTKKLVVLHYCPLALFKNKEDHVALDKGHYRPVCSIKLHSFNSTL